jgi:hypothetical protein
MVAGCSPAAVRVNVTVGQIVVPRRTDTAWGAVKAELVAEKILDSTTIFCYPCTVDTDPRRAQA